MLEEEIVEVEELTELEDTALEEDFAELEEDFAELEEDFAELEEDFAELEEDCVTGTIDMPVQRTSSI